VKYKVKLKTPRLAATLPPPPPTLLDFETAIPVAQVGGGYHVAANHTKKGKMNHILLL
jgi:hypothetical protein